MKDPQFYVSIDNLNRGILTIQCGGCNKQNKMELSQVNPEEIIKCACGTEIHLNDDLLRNLNLELYNLRITLKQ